MDNAARLHPDEDLYEMMEWRDDMDPHYAKLWLDWTYGGLYTRTILSDRVRILVVIGQCVALGELEELPVHIRSALAHKATPREVLEVILQLTVYIGYQRVIRAARIFREVVTKLGRMDEVKTTQLPLDGTNSQRTLESDRATWRVSEAEFPRREELMKKYGWRGIGSGLRLMRTYHPQSVELLDRVDQHFTKAWLDWVYAEMFTRGILDDKTRQLIVVGEVMVLGETAQIENHMRAALMQGATPREVLEVVLHSTIYIGMPSMTRMIRSLVRILEEQGRMAEVTETQLPVPA
ncbi:MAG: carboxymuconolactone decarboxylase family protein [Sulfuricaulis sp.]|nr:carboxymuconolactone decarboxylase family protein [Sulfuricaulis sp.]